MVRWRWFLLLCFLHLFVLGCGDNPEDLLVSRWEESTWVYELIDRHPDDVKRVDGIRLGAFEERTVARHEAEYWQFRADRSFEIRLDDGTVRSGRWRLKGRGHILTLRYASGEVEVYDIKELGGDELVLNFDMGMEIRGIARLGFSRVADKTSHRTSQLTRKEAPAELGGPSS